MKGLKSKIISAKLISEWVVRSNSLPSLLELRKNIDLRIRDLYRPKDIDKFKNVSLKRKLEIMKPLLIKK